MKSYFASIIAFAGLLLSSCGGGFIESPGGVEYKLVEHDESAKKPAEGDVIWLDLRMVTEDDSVLMDTKEITKIQPERFPSGKYKMLLQKAKFKGDPFEVFNLLHVGDSAVIKCNLDTFFAYYFKGAPVDSTWKGTKLTLYTKVLGTQTRTEAEAEDNKYFEKIMNEGMKGEDKALADYLAKNSITTPALPSGLIFIETQAGTGAKPTKGQLVSVNYKGTLLNGNVFDSSEGRGPFQFILGEGMVIPAWDEAIALMKVGGKAKIICPSKIAYADRGAGDVIPPFSSLVFEVELVKTENPPKESGQPSPMPNR